MWGLALADFGCDPRINDSLRGIVFSKKLFTKFPGLATSGRHHYAMITDRRKFAAKWSHYMACNFNCVIKSEGFSESQPILYIYIHYRMYKW